MDLDFNGSDCAFKLVSQILVGQVRVPGQKQHFALPGGQAQERLSELGQIGPVFQVTKGSFRGVRSLHGMVFNREIRPNPFKVLPMSITGYLKQPRLEGCPGSVAPTVFQDTEEYLLDQVLTHSPLPSETQEEIEQVDLMTLEENGQHFNPSLADEGHHLRIIHWEQVSFPMVIEDWL
jgi:hypothetical protein